MNIKPLFDYIVVDVNKPQESTKSGFVLTSNSSNGDHAVAKVLKAGAGGIIYGKQIDMVVKEGDKIVIPTSAIIKIKVEDQEVNVIRLSDVIAIIE